LAKFVAQVTRENSDIIGLSVYNSRLFRFSSFNVNRSKASKPPSLVFASIRRRPSPTSRYRRHRL
jgi:hypothetical protein